MNTTNINGIFPQSQIFTQCKPFETVEFKIDNLRKILSTFDIDNLTDYNGVSILTVFGGDNTIRALITNWIIQYFECEEKGWLESWIAKGLSGEQRGFEEGISWSSTLHSSDQLLQPSPSSSGIYLWPCMFKLKQDRSPCVLILYIHQANNDQKYKLEQLAPFLCSRLVEISWDSQNFKLLKQRHELMEAGISDHFCKSFVLILDAESNSSIPRYMTKLKVKKYLTDQDPKLTSALENFQHFNIGVIKKCPEMLQDTNGSFNENKIKNAAQHIKNIVSIITQNIGVPKTTKDGIALTLDTLPDFFQSVTDAFNKHFNLKCISKPQPREMVTTAQPLSAAIPETSETENILNEIFGSITATVTVPIHLEKSDPIIDNQLRQSSHTTLAACSTSPESFLCLDELTAGEESIRINSPGSSVTSDSWSRVDYIQPGESTIKPGSSLETINSASTKEDDDYMCSKISYCLWNVEGFESNTCDSDCHFDQRQIIVFHLNGNQLIVAVAVDANNATVVLNEFEEHATPAIIALTTDHQLMYGSEAINNRNIGGCEASVKRWSLEDYLCSSLTVVNDVISLNNKHFLVSLKTIAGFIFYKLRRAVQKEYQGQHTEALIAVPSWIPPEVKTEIVLGAKIAGFVKIEIVNEMSACAVYNLMPKMMLPEDAYILLMLSQNQFHLSAAAYVFKKCDKKLAPVSNFHANYFKLTDPSTSAGEIIGRLASSLMETYPAFDISKMDCVIMSESQEWIKSLEFTIKTYFPDIICTVNVDGVIQGASFIGRRDSLANIPILSDELESYCVDIGLVGTTNQEPADKKLSYSTKLVQGLCSGETQNQDESALFDNLQTIYKPKPAETTVEASTEQSAEIINDLSSVEETTLENIEEKVETEERPENDVTSTSIPNSTRFLNWEHLEASSATLLTVSEAIKESIDSGAVRFTSDFIRELTVEDIASALELAQKENGTEEEIHEMIDTMKQICLQFNIELPLQLGCLK